MKATIPEKFSGSILGGMLGDAIGAVVEGESSGYIQKTFKNADEILCLESVEELFGGKWQVGRFTDDTQMSLCVAEWLLNEEKLDGKSLLSRFSHAYHPARRYGPGAGMILEAFPKHQDKWEALATMMFPQGSYGNGSAMRVGPVGLYFHNDLPGLRTIARISSTTTHSHWLAIQGAVLQATAVALATRAGGEIEVEQFLKVLELSLSHFEESGDDTTVYKKALKTISQGLSVRFPPAKVAHILGTGIKAQEAVPMAIYCFLANKDSFEKAVEEAVFLGGDTDTIAAMTGTISGAYLGVGQIPQKWLNRIQEDSYSPKRVCVIADSLYKKALKHGFKRQQSR